MGKHRSALALGILILSVSPDAGVAQGFSSFYPLGDGDYWIYFEYSYGGVGVWDTITTRVERDTVFGGHDYWKVESRSSHYQRIWASYQRVNAHGDVYSVDPATGEESLSYRLSDTSRSWWASAGRLQRFDSCRVEPLFGSPRAALYVGAYTIDPPDYDTLIYSTRVLIDGLGYSSTLWYGLVDGGRIDLVGGSVGGSAFGIVTTVENHLSVGTVDLADMQAPFPNPFNSSMMVAVSLPTRCTVSLQVADILGRHVATILEGQEGPGDLKVLWSAPNQPCGIYFIQMRAPGIIQTRRVLLLK